MSSILPVRANYLTRRRKSGSRHLLLRAPCRYAAAPRQLTAPYLTIAYRHRCRIRTAFAVTYCIDEIFSSTLGLRQCSVRGATCNAALKLAGAEIKSTEQVTKRVLNCAASRGIRSPCAELAAQYSHSPPTPTAVRPSPPASP